MKPVSFMIITFLLSSCEVYRRYYVISTNKYEATEITVKVSNIYDLPKQKLPAYKNLVRSKALFNNEKKFDIKLSMKLDSNKIQYSFVLPPNNTVWLQPTKIGIPALKYIIINGKDSVYLANKSNNYGKNLKYKRLPNQKFVIILK